MNKTELFEELDGFFLPQDELVIDNSLIFDVIKNLMYIKDKPDTSSSTKNELTNVILDLVSYTTQYP